MSMMKDIPIRNKQILDILNDASNFFVNEEVCKCVTLNCSHEKDNVDWWTGDDHLNQVLSKGREHNGFPEVVYAYGFQHNTVRYTDVNRFAKTTKEIVKKHGEITTQLETLLSLKTNALFSVYPPGGFISWHNNANASAYNFIFTYSETGDGYFEYLDENREKVRVPDVKGWQCKAGYFGAYQDGEDRLVYHTARTNCWRMTIAFVLDRSQMSLGMQEWVIDDLMSANG